MLQRIQSIYLLLAALAIYALFLFPFVHNVFVDGKPVTIAVTGVFDDTNGHHLHTQFFAGLTVATAILGLIPLVIIFLYKNRKQQIALCYSAILAIIGYSFWMSHEVKDVMGNIEIDTHNWGIGLLLSSFSIVFIILAFKAIQRDEKLVKSADRLR
jgi:phosphatidylserine synthase